MPALRSRRGREEAAPISGNQSAGRGRPPVTRSTRSAPPAPAPPPVPPPLPAAVVAPREATPPPVIAPPRQAVCVEPRYRRPPEFVMRPCNERRETRSMTVLQERQRQMMALMAQRPPPEPERNADPYPRLPLPEPPAEECPPLPKEILEEFQLVEDEQIHIRPHSSRKIRFEGTGIVSYLVLQGLIHLKSRTGGYPIAWIPGHPSHNQKVPPGTSFGLLRNKPIIMENLSSTEAMLVSTNKSNHP